MHTHASAPSDHTHDPYARFGTFQPYAHPYARFGAFLSDPDSWNRDSAELLQDCSRNVPEGLGPASPAPGRRPGPPASVPSGHMHGPCARRFGAFRSAPDRSERNSAEADQSENSQNFPEAIPPAITTRSCSHISTTLYPFCQSLSLVAW